jgi:predicted dehydrogenase
MAVTTTVGLVGASGHGRWHRRRLAELPRFELVALCDVRPVEDAGGVAVYPTHTAMLAARRPDIVIVVTPPHTHLPIARDVLEAGCDLLLEKPPVLDRAEQAALETVVARTGRACQVGFQALGSDALTRLAAAITAGRLGTVTGVAAAGAWWRPDAYWTRSPWAGRRTVDGGRTLDGAFGNAFAHALMQSLAVASVAADGATEGAASAAGGAGWPGVLELERYRTRAGVEVEDTASLRLTGAGPTLSAAVTLCSAEFIPGDLTVTGTRGTAVLEYPTDKLWLDGAPQPVGPRRGLLENLADHRATGAPLIAPLRRVRPFTELVEALAAAPAPALLDAHHLVPHPDGTGRIIAGVAAAVREAATRQALFSELSVPWAPVGSPR